MKSAKAEGLVLKRAAIYARKSTKVEGAISVTRQIEHARKLIGTKGWSLAEEHIFAKDDGISGAEFQDREDLLRMLIAADSKPRAFDVVVVQEQSRLGRDEKETMPVLYRLHRAGVAVYCFLNDQQIGLDSIPGRMMASMQAYMDEWEREIASQRARDTFIRKANAGHVTGGECYGYVRVRMASHVEHRINAEEAEVVRTVFRMYADGHGYDTIAKALNLDPDPRYIKLNKQYIGGRRVSSPKAGKRHTGTWAVTALHEMLRRERYIGQVVSGKFRNIVKDGNADARERVPESDWIRVSKPELRIVPPELWDAVRAKIAAHPKTKGKGNRVGSGGFAGESRWLLSGIARCGSCGASMVVVNGGARRHYGCSYHRTRGAVACRNDTRVYVQALDRAVLEAVVETAMNPDTVRSIAAEAWKALRTPKQRDPRAALDKQIADAERRLRNLLDVAAAGERKPEAILAAIREAETELRALKASRAETAAVTVAATDEVALRRHVERVVGEWRTRLAKDVAVARQALRSLLAGGTVAAKVVKRPDGERVYAVEGETVLGALVTGAHALKMASPRGNLFQSVPLPFYREAA
jgi:DNA invertase Pin-like site-specific DNA recombinase